MALIGKYNVLKVVKELDFGMYVDGGEHGEILLPTRYIPPNCKVDDEIEVFIYCDSDDRLIATTEMPEVEVGEFAYLKCVEVSKIGAFVDWGLPKDLLVPFSEQKVKLEKDKSYVCYTYLDDTTQRIAASAKVEKFLDNVPPEYTEGDQVDVLIYGISDLGYKAIINNLHSGILYKNEVFKRLHIGTECKAYIKKIRSDEKIDLSLEKLGYTKVDGIAQRILDKLEASEGGQLPINDKSSSDEISRYLGISKKSFKQAVGLLYKQRKITIAASGIYLNE